MLKSHILAVNAQNNEPLRLAPDSSLILSSAGGPWKGIVVEHQLLPPTETPDVYMTSHLLSLRLGPPGVMEVKAEGRLERRNMVPGDVFFQAAGAPVRSAWREETEVLNLALESTLVAEVALESFDLNAADLVSEDGGTDPQVAHVGMALKAEIEAGYPAGRLYADSLTAALAARVLVRYGARPPVVQDRPPSGSRRALREAEDYVNDNLARNVTLAELAGVARMSPYHFSRTFKDATGLSPHQYLIHRRVKKAQELLLNTDLPVGDVARGVGFASQGHLARHFGRLVGLSPGSFRRQGRR